jgi:tagatose 6-phosphate kinase
MMRELLAARGVGEQCVEVPAPTRICTTLMEDGRASVTELVEEAATPSDDEWRALFGRCRDLLPGSSYAIIAGALPPHSPVDIYAMLARAAREAGTPLLIDSQKQPLLAALTHGPLLVKLNVHELGNTFGRALRSQRDIIESSREIHHRGAQWVLVTNGARAAYLVGAAGAHVFAPPKIQAVNAVGSGDATTAGIAAALLAGEPMPQAMTMGLACGAANAMTLTPADVNAETARSLRANVKLRTA